MLRRCAPANLLILLVPLCMACTPLPDIPPLAQTGAAPPVLLPLDTVLAGIAAPRATDDSATALALRAARLQNRARLMRGPVLAPETRARLATAIAQGAA
jgi:hypothetical protein